MTKDNVARTSSYSPTEEEPSEFESGTFRCVQGSPESGPPEAHSSPADAAADDEAGVRQALMAALFLLARQAARLSNRGDK
jgi:hypothetical protein